MFRRLSFLIAAAALALGACSSGTPAASPLTDPKAILTQSVEALSKVKSFHIAATVTGTLTIDLMGTGSPTPLELKGTTLEGDIDLANKKLHISFAAPALLGVTGDIIVIDKTSYVRVSLLGNKYTKSTSTDTTAPTDPSNIVDEVNKFLDQPGVNPVKLPDEKCGDLDCYHVQVKITSDQLGGVLPSGLESAAPSGDGTIDVLIHKNDLLPSKLTVAATAGDMGTIAVDVVFSNYNGTVTVNPPADSDIEPSAS